MYALYPLCNIWSPRNRFPFQSRDQEGCSVVYILSVVNCLGWNSSNKKRHLLHECGVPFHLVDCWESEYGVIFNDVFTRVFLQSQVYHTLPYSRKQHHFASLSLEGRTKTTQKSESTRKWSFVYFSAPDWHEASRKAAIPVSIARFSE